MPYPSGSWTVGGQPSPYQTFWINFSRDTGQTELLTRTDSWHVTVATYDFQSLTPTPTSILNSTPTILPTATLPSSGYDRVAAVNYADQWAHARNGNYPNYGSGCNCNDCTNYISQVLNNGNYPLNTGNWDVNSSFEWWYKPVAWWYENSNTWSATDWFNIYVAQYKNEFDVNPPLSILEGGDFILLDLRDNDNPDDPPDGTPDHARAVIGYGNTSTNTADYISYTGSCEVINNPAHPSIYTLLVNQHCTDRWHIAWNYNIESDTNRWYIHVTW